MAGGLQDHVADEVNISRKQSENIQSTSTGNHIFPTVEKTGSFGDYSEWKQRAATMAIALVICITLYGLLYLAMHFQE